MEADGCIRCKKGTCTSITGIFARGDCVDTVYLVKPSPPAAIGREWFLVSHGGRRGATNTTRIYLLSQPSSVDSPQAWPRLDEVWNRA